MFLFRTGKENLIARFKARFTPNPDTEGYLFYSEDYSNSFSCTTAQYESYLNEFVKFLKIGTRILWLWLLVCIPLMLWLELVQNFEFTIYTAAPFFLMPFPFLFAKGAKLFNAPNALTKNRTNMGKPRTQKEVMDARIKGMSWTMLLGLTLVPILGSYVFLTDTSLQEWQVAIGLCFFAAVSCTGIYLLFRKRKSQKK